MSRVLSLTRLFGVDPVQTVQSLRGIPPFVRDWSEWRRKAGGHSEFPLSRFYPCLSDRWVEAGSGSGGYFHQDLLVAQRVFDTAPERHVDVGSRIDGFVAHVAAFRPIEVIDIRPLTTTARNIRFIQSDMMRPLSDELTSCTDSLSCLHALEHFGLGRYGDPIDPDGHRKAFANLIGMLKPKGRLFLSVPIGTQRLEFNGHRVFKPAYIAEMAAESLRLDRFSYVDDAGQLHEDFPTDDLAAHGAFGCHYGVGIFEFIRAE